MERSHRHPDKVVMPFEEWRNIPGCEIQRDTHKHLPKLLKAVKQNGGELAQHGYTVEAAQLPTGHRIKLNGHTRTLAWERNDLPAPKTVICLIYHLADLEEVKREYKTYDPPSASKSVKDQVKSAYLENGMDIKTDLLLQGGIKTSLELITGRADNIQEMVRLWKPELQLLDNLQVPRDLMLAGFVSAAILTFRKHSTSKAYFWEKYAKREGTMIDGRRDAVRCLLDHNQRIRLEKRSGGSGNLAEHCNLALAHFEWFVGGNERRKATPRGLSYGDYLPASANIPTISQPN